MPRLLAVDQSYPQNEGKQPSKEGTPTPLQCLPTRYDSVDRLARKFAKGVVPSFIALRSEGFGLTVFCCHRPTPSPFVAVRGLSPA
jgi:hypothetical protein